MLEEENKEHTDELQVINHPVLTKPISSSTPLTSGCVVVTSIEKWKKNANTDLLNKKQQF